MSNAHNIVNNNRFSKKIVLITGATGGIGRALVDHFYREGAYVLMVGRHQNTLNAVVKHYHDAYPHEDHDRCVALVADLAQRSSVLSLIEKQVSIIGAYSIRF